MSALVRRIVFVMTACGGAASAPAHGPKPIALEPVVATQTWYRAQGPFEVELPIDHTKWGEETLLLVHTPRRIAIHAVVLADGAEVGKTDGVFDATGPTAGKPDNARCVADARERLAMVHAGGAGDSGGAGAPTGPTGPSVAAPSPPTAAAQLVVDSSVVAGSYEIIRWSARPQTRAVRIRFWSIEPNDLDGVAFGAAHVVWRPNVSEAEYEAHLAAVREQQRLAAVREQQRQAQRQATVVPSPQVQVVATYDPEAERARAEAELEAEHRRQVAAALEAERVQRRHAFCDAHPDDRDCWGPGGRHVVLDLEQHQRERDGYCGQHAQDARCWTDAERTRRTSAWQHRVDAALTPIQPDGPPPAPLAETASPQPSTHATWRPGYWQWTDATWVWLAGMWRVPDSDFAGEQTATAPSAPPPPQAEVPTAAPVRAAVWVAGFWMWSGTAWVWVAGSWQLRPEPRVTWRAARWQPRGAVHVLVPGGWVHVQ